MAITYLGLVGSIAQQRTPKNASASPPTPTVAYSGAVAKGKLVVLLCAWWSGLGGAPLAHLSDTQGNTYNLVNYHSAANDPISLAIYSCKLANPVTAADTLSYFVSGIYLDGPLTVFGPSAAVLLAFDGAGAVDGSDFAGSITSPTVDANLTSASVGGFFAGPRVAVGCFGTYSAEGADHTSPVAAPYTVAATEPIQEIGQEIPQAGYPNAGLLGDGQEASYLTCFYQIIPSGAAAAHNATVNPSPEAWWYDGVLAWFKPDVTNANGLDFDRHPLTNQLFLARIASDGGLWLDRYATDGTDTVEASRELDAATTCGGVCLRFLPDGTLLAGYSNGSHIRILVSRDSGRSFTLMDDLGAGQAVSFDADSTAIYAAVWDGNTTLSLLVGTGAAGGAVHWSASHSIVTNGSGSFRVRRDRSGTLEVAYTDNGSPSRVKIVRSRSVRSDGTATWA